MKEIFDLSFTSVNLLPTILMIFVGLYWLVFMVGLLDFSFLDFDLDVGKDVEIDIDLDADIGTEADTEANLGKGTVEPGLGVSFLIFLNLDHVPFMVFFSFFSLFFWAISIVGHAYFGDGTTVTSLWVALAAAILAALSTKLLTQPFKKFFRSLNVAEKEIDFKGKLCLVELGAEKEKIGQAEITIDGKHILLYIRSETGKRINKGVECVILEKDESGDFYFVQPLDLE